MRKSAKYDRVTNPERQLLHPSFAEAIALPPTGLSDTELSAELASIGETRKHVPKKSVRS